VQPFPRPRTPLNADLGGFRLGLGNQLCELLVNARPVDLLAERWVAAEKHDTSSACVSAAQGFGHAPNPWCDLHIIPFA